MAKRRRRRARRKSTKKGKYKWTKRILFWGTVIVAVRETYLAFGPRRTHRRTVYEDAKQRAAELGRPLIVLGDPDASVLNHFLGRSWQCGDICIDPKGCGGCIGGEEVQADPIQYLSTLGDNSAVIFDGGSTITTVENGVALAEQMQRVAGPNVFISADGPWTLTAFLAPKRKRRILEEPQVQTAPSIVFKPVLWHKEPETGRKKVTYDLSGLRGFVGPGYTSALPYPRGW
jgi:hypothetical protein